MGRRLTGAEESLQDFREVEQVVSIQAEADAQVAQLSQLQADRNTIEAERDALSTLVTEIDQEAATADPGGAVSVRAADLVPDALPQPGRRRAAAHPERGERRSAPSLLRQRTMQDPDVIAVTNRIHQIETQLRNTALTYLQGLENQVAGYDRMLAQFSTELERIPGKEIQLARLQRQQKVLEEIFTLLQNRLQEARILEAVDDPTVRTVDPAILPSEPVKPRTMLNLLLGVVLGGMLGVGIAFLREYMDETVHTREDVQAAAGGAPVLGMIPRIRTVGMNGRAEEAVVPGELGARLVAGRDPRNPVSEAYRSLRTNLTFANLERPPKTIVFTSALPQDGKSTSAANLSITLAQQGIRTLLVDADLRRGVLHNVFGVEREPGLTNALTGTCDVTEAIRQIDLGESGTAGLPAERAVSAEPGRGAGLAAHARAPREGRGRCTTWS